jgi:hypothetical protein
MKQGQIPSGPQQAQVLPLQPNPKYSRIETSLSLRLYYYTIHEKYMETEREISLKVEGNEIKRV